MTQDGAFTDWLMADSWQDYRQQRAIRELDGEVLSLSSSLSRQGTESRRLRSQLAALQGSVEERLRTLTRAFDAFVELSDIRAILSMFDPPALVRHRMRQLLAALADAAVPAGAVGFDDVPGYWLAAAAPALVALLRGQDGGPALERALHRDPTRTALLLALATSVAGRADLAVRWLPRALPPLPADRPMTRAQRMLWTEALHGRFGDDGVDLVRQRLTDLVAGLTPAQDEAMAQAAVQRAAAPPASRRTAADASTQAATAAERLARLRVLCGQSGAAPAGASASTVETVLRDLVDEGSDEESPLLRRAAELRAVIENRESAPDGSWDAPAGTPTELLLADAFGAGGAPAHLARQVTARWLVAAARPLAAEATVAAPAQTTLDIAGVPVRVSAQGPGAGDLAQARAAIGQRYPQRAAGRWLGWTLAVAGAALLGTVALLPTGWAGLAALAGAGCLIGAAVRWSRRRREGVERAAQQAGEVAEAERRARLAAGELVALRQRLAALAGQAAADLAAIESSLAGGGSPAPAAASPAAATREAPGEPGRA